MQLIQKSLTNATIASRTRGGVKKNNLVRIGQKGGRGSQFSGIFWWDSKWTVPNLKWQSGERSVKIEVEDRIWRLKWKIEFEDWYRKWRNSWTSCCSNEDRISRLAKALKWKIYHLLFVFSAQASTLGVFKHASGPGSANLQIFQFIVASLLWASIFVPKQRDIDSFWQ